MKFCWKSLFSISTLLALVTCSSTKTNTECKIGIIGGGPAGVYMAYKLSLLGRDGICLFEKEAQLGGRMTDDVFVDPVTKSEVWVGKGARRVNEVQKQVIELAKELNIELQIPEKREQLIQSKSLTAIGADSFIKKFPGLIGPLDKDPSTTREDEIYALLLQKKESAKDYLTLRAYIEAVAGKPAFEYLRTVSRFHADFDYDLSAANYLDTLEKELQLSSVNLYPVGGMNVFLKKMQERLISKGVKIFLSETLIAFQENENQNSYQLQTTKQNLSVNTLILAIPPLGFDFVEGAIAKQIRDSQEYKSLLPIPIVVINQQWEQAWWRELKVWRAWSIAQCVNHTEIPQEVYAASANVIRSVYTDDPKCAKFWMDQLKNKGIFSVEKQVLSGLQNLLQSQFPKKHLQIPKPLLTKVHYWPAGWYFIRAGTKVSNAEIAKWALEPIQGRKNLMLVGEAYWPDRPGWSEGAYFSADAALDAMFKNP